MVRISRNRENLTVIELTRNNNNNNAGKFKEEFTVIELTHNTINSRRNLHTHSILRGL